jgi:hypothetical protein
MSSILRHHFADILHHMWQTWHIVLTAGSTQVPVAGSPTTPVDTGRALFPGSPAEIAARRSQDAPV